MSSAKKLGTLVVVVLKARNLKDFHTFYKQDPYALVRLGGTEKSTNIDPKGGQHPVWDEEFHFTVREVASGVDGRTLSVVAYSKEHKVDQLIGEGKVDVTDTLVMGEFDDWVKLELNGAYRGEIYLEMTYYSAAPPLARRPSKLSPNDLLRPPPTPPKETTSPYLSPQRSPQFRPSSSTSSSPRIQPASSPYFRPSSPHLYPAVSPPSSSPRPDGPHVQTVPLLPSSTPPRQPYVDPMLKNIPFLDVGPSAHTPVPAPAPALYSVPSVLRPRNVRSSPIPIPAREDAPPPPPKDDLNGSYWFQQELAESDAVFAAQLAESEGIDVARLKAQEADAELARRLADEDLCGVADEVSVPGSWIG